MHSTSTGKESSINSSLLKQKLLKESKTKASSLLSFTEKDYDNDGIEEAFAFIGSKVVDEYVGGYIYEGEIWFVSETICLKIAEANPPTAFGFSMVDGLLDFGSVKYYYCNNHYTTAEVSYVWAVVNGKPVECPFSKIGEIVKSGNNMEFTILDSSYDVVYDHEVKDWMGHSWKQYYFYFDPKDKTVYEYGGTNISRNEMKRKCGIDLINTAIPAGAVIDNIYYRSNGIIHINYHKLDKSGDITNGHINWNIKEKCYIDDWGDVLDNQECEGKYRKALCPEIATYNNGSMYKKVKSIK